MKRATALFLTTLLASVAFVSSVFAGNGAPQGPHDYQLNIIGTSDKNPNMTGGNGARIFVDLNGDSRIALQEGNFAVIDANGTDGWATFQLPKPGLDAFIVGDPGDADVESEYSVFIRPLGKPGGWATITTCADLLDSTFGGLLGNQQTNDHRERHRSGDRRVLLDRAGRGRHPDPQQGQVLVHQRDGAAAHHRVRSDGRGCAGRLQDLPGPRPDLRRLLENEYWLYDNNGLRLAQVRFYDCSTNVATGESTC